MYTGTPLTTAIHRRLLSRFFLREGGRLYTGYHNSRSQNGRKTTPSAPAVCRRISVATLTFIAGFPQTDFDKKLVNFFLKLVLSVILKELQSFLLYVHFENCHKNKLDNYFIYLVLAYFLVFLVGVYSCRYSFPSKFSP